MSNDTVRVILERARGYSGVKRDSYEAIAQALMEHIDDLQQRTFEAFNDACGDIDAALAALKEKGDEN